MVSVLGFHEQDRSPIILDSPQRASGLAPFCIRSILSYRQDNFIVSGKKFVRLARCDASLMKQAVLDVPKTMDKYFTWYLDRVGVEIKLPEWYSWYLKMLSDLHRYRHWHNEDSIRWEFSEVAATLNPRYDALRNKSVRVWRPELKQCIGALQEFLGQPDGMKALFRYTCNGKYLEDNTEAQSDKGVSKYKFVALCLRSPEDETVVEYHEEWDFEWGEYDFYQTDCWGEESQRYVW
ncbi:uncharacterized protein DFL_000396 [Arthrobotrys flagrans]|uniref:Uncharacterized protein n=1 Tax=Arthrobotrys flagrans TaxID=97331 RepID=A0A437ADL8_ARTFL|nr:hypothetical protein DFL_000396 [Arthrobotrys flagrans]